MNSLHFHQSSCLPRGPIRSARGFALISVLAILALLIVLVLSISTVLHVETRSSASGKNQLIARENALLGLQTAMSQLQEYAGKDQAVTFPATTFYPTKNVTNASGPLFDDATFGYRAKAATAPRKTFLAPDKRKEWDDALKNWWNADRNPRWTGIADASLRRDGTPSGKYGEPKRDQLPVWLVSGNEKFTIDQNTDTAYPAGYQTPDTALPDPATDDTIIYLVGEGSAADETASSDGMDGRVKVKKQEVSAADAGGTVQVTGHYAYWVGDESTKANFAVRDRTSTNDATYPNDVSNTSVAYRNRLQVPQRVGWENIEGFELATFDSNDPKLENISTSKEIGLLEGTNTQNIKDAARTNFHSLTAFSRSLFTDTALGGLKKDLTGFLEGSGSGLAGPIPDASLYDPNDPRFGGSSNNGFPRVSSATAGLPTWSQIKGWYDNDESGRAPVLANYQIFVAFTHKNGEIQFHLLPCIALWNPYDAPLSSATYTLKIRHNFQLYRMGFGVENSTYVDPTPGATDADDADGRKVSDYFISPLLAKDWYATANKFGVNFTNSADSGKNLWNDPKATPDYRWSPFDLGSSLPESSNANATWVPYRFTSGFAAGEVKIFTVGSSQQVDPEKLHAGTEVINLQNDFEPDFPQSAWFPFATGLSKQPGAPPGSTDTVRWYGEILATGTINTFPMRLERGGQTLWEYQYTGAPGMVRWFNSTYLTDPDKNTAAAPSSWKQVYHLDDWDSKIKSDHDARYRDSPIMGMVSTRISPFIVKFSTSLYSSGSFKQDGLANFHRLFAHSNLSAKNIGLMQDLDYARSDIGNNNQDGFATRRIFESQGADYEIKWDFDQVTGTNGFALFGWQSEDPNRKTLGLSEVPLRHVRAAFNLLSLGQFQQANLAEYYWQPGFAVGNSEASPYVDRNRAAGLQSYQVRNATGTIYMLISQPAIAVNTPRSFPNDATNRFLDLSFTLNENMWDRYFLSSIPQSGALKTDNTDPLPNSRHRFVNSPAVSDVRDFPTAAAHLENFGALNVNSTSVQAWKALLTSFRNLEIVSQDAKTNPGDTVPVSRNLAPQQGPVEFLKPDGTTVKADYGAVNTDRDYSKMFFGFRYLTDAQIQTLAERIVDEIRLRGPFYSMADFVNRRLVSPDLSGSHWLTARTSNLNPGSSFSTTHGIDPAYDPLVGMFGLNGAIQRAINVSGINGGVNYPLYPPATSAQYDRTFAVNSAPAADPEIRMQQYSEAAGYLDTEHLAGVPAGEVGQLLSHAPGFVTQGDILAMIGPALTPRGDTFLVRTYGDATDKTGKKVLARAYLEAVVQRVVDPVTPAGTAGEDKWRYTDKFGRKFEVVKLRWLNPEEI